MKKIIEQSYREYRTSFLHLWPIHLIFWCWIIIIPFIEDISLNEILDAFKISILFSLILLITYLLVIKKQIIITNTKVKVLPSIGQGKEIYFDEIYFIDKFHSSRAPISRYKLINVNDTKRNLSFSDIGMSIKNSNKIEDWVQVTNKLRQN